MKDTILPVAIEILILTAVYLAASAITWSWRRRCHDEDLLTLTIGGALRHALARLSRALAVLAITVIGLQVAGGVSGFDAFLIAHPQYGRHLDAWFLFWELVLLIGAVEGLVVFVYRVRRRPFPVPDLLLNIVRLVLVLLAMFGVLSIKLGVDVSPLLGASALLTAVVGFALQGVLGNLLSGMSMHLVSSMMPGDWVSIDGTEGEVLQTNWRETRLRTVAGHIMVIPNSAVASAKIHNMTRPTPLRRHSIPVGASYSDAPGDVIAALIDSALSVPEVLREPAPSAALTEYKDFGINYQLRFWSNRYFDRTMLEGDVMRMIWYQFKRRNIEIPFPMSDKLLNDFMEVVYNQRNQLPDEAEAQRNLSDLVHSDFVSKLLVDEKGAPLLKDGDLKGIARAARRVRYTRGETVFRQGDAGETCYVVVWGRVHGRVEYKDASQAHEFDIGPGSLFGEMSLVTGLPRTATLLANEEVELLEISREMFTQLLGLRDDIPAALAKLAAARAEHNRAMLDKLRALDLSKVDESLKSASILTRFLRMLGRGR